MKVEVTMPEEYMGDVIGSLNAKRGQIEGMDDIGGGKIVRAFVSTWLRCSVILQSFVPVHRVVVTTPCSSRSTSSVLRTYRKKFLQIRQVNNLPLTL